jgi:predicted phage terminase large subunit-like protein
MKLNQRMRQIEAGFAAAQAGTLRHGQTPEDLLAFTLQVLPHYQPASLHRYLAAKLEVFLAAIEREESPRLLLSMPPRHGKSQLASISFPAYVLGKHPDWPIIHTSYAADLSNDFSRDVRSLLRSPEYQHCFPGVLPASDGGSVERWGIAGRRGVFVSTGVGGPLTGRGAMLAIIDDPVKNAQEADSELLRARQRDWYTSTLYTRLEKGAGILLIMTRWHEADLAGFVTTGAGTDEPPAEAWEVINLPAIAGKQDPLGRAPGEALWPEKYDLAALQRIEKQVAPRWWHALYQGTPLAAEGNFFEVRQIRHAIPERASLQIYQGWDLAISTKTSADYTACATIGVDSDQNVYLLDLTRGRWTFNETMERMGELARIWKPVSIGVEVVSYQSAAFQEATRRYLLPFREVRPEKDKQVRAQLLADRIACEKVSANKQASWWRAFEVEALAFPTGAHDDMVDAAVCALTLAESQPWYYNMELAHWLGSR